MVAVNCQTETWLFRDGSIIFRDNQLLIDEAARRPPGGPFGVGPMVPSRGTKRLDDLQERRRKREIDITVAVVVSCLSSEHFTEKSRQVEE